MMNSLDFSGFGEAATLVDMLERRAREHPDRLAFRYLEKGDGDGVVRTYGEVAERARRLAATIQAGVPGNARGLIMCPPGLDYVTAFFGCVYAGTIAVPVYPPSPLVPGRAIGRLRTVAADVGASFALTVASLAGTASSMEIEGSPLEWIFVDDADIGDEDAWRAPAIGPGDLALLQYTSGSTSDPKGVMLTHGNVLANLAMVSSTYRVDEGISVVSWVPPYHDMGLVTGILGPIANGGSSTLMSTDAFLRNPIRWLRAIATHQAAMSSAPNFAYELCVRKAARADLDGLDLSSWRVAINGAEPVRAATVRRFTAAFAPYGLRADVMWPSYGMAETAVLVSAGQLGADATILEVDRDALAGGRVVAGRSDADVDPVALVSCGRPPAGSRVLVVDDDSRRPLEAEHLGEIWVAGPHVASGYWGREDESAVTFQATAVGVDGRYLRTGDLGFLTADGALVVTGRAKDVVIVRGVNYYPQEFEQVMEAAHVSLRPDCGVAFTIEDGHRERLVLVQGVNLRAKDSTELADAADSIVRAVTLSHGVRPHVVVLVAPKHVARTTSGKVRRSAMRAAFLEGQLPALHEWSRSL